MEPLSLTDFLDPNCPRECPDCHLPLSHGDVTHSVPVGDEMFEIENVPAVKCTQCGAYWLEKETVESIERLVKENAGKENSASV